MGSSVELLMFEHLLARPDADLNIEHLALVLCELDRPNVNILSYLDKLDVLGELARIRLRFSGRIGSAPADRIGPVLRLLYGELGFHGNTSDYYDHRNSYLNYVIDRRTGNPLSLAVLLIAVCRRAGIRVEGISFPGHFLVRVAKATADWMYVDPFDGRVLTHADLRSLYESATDDPGEIDERYLAMASCRQMVLRMLNNLRAIYELHGDQDHVRRILERLALVTPHDEVQRRLEAVVKAEALGPRLSLN
jgi:regulator of sirC expression with transglutaminase-like and TPR domain